MKLKPCPFCGDTHVSHTRRDNPGDFPGHVVNCGECEADGPWSTKSKEQAVERWNTRVSPWRSLKDDPPEPRQLPEYVIRKRGVTKGVYLLGLLWSDGHTWTMVDGEDTPGPGPLEVSLDTLIHEGFAEWMEIPA